MAENLHLDIGQTIIVGITAGIIPALAGWMVARWASRRLDAPMRETGGVALADLEQMVARREDQLPSLTWSLIPVLLPIALIGGASFFAVLGGHQLSPALFAILEFVGNRNIALVIGAGRGIVAGTGNRSATGRQRRGLAVPGAGPLDNGWDAD